MLEQFDLQFVGQGFAGVHDIDHDALGPYCHILTAKLLCAGSKALNMQRGVVRGRPEGDQTEYRTPVASFSIERSLMLTAALGPLIYYTWNNCRSKSGISTNGVASPYLLGSAQTFVRTNLPFESSAVLSFPVVHGIESTAKLVAGGFVHGRNFHSVITTSINGDTSRLDLTAYLGTMREDKLPLLDLSLYTRLNCPDQIPHYNRKTLSALTAVASLNVAHGFVQTCLALESAEAANARLVDDQWAMAEALEKAGIPILGHFTPEETKQLKIPQ